MYGWIIDEIGIRKKEEYIYLYIHSAQRFVAMFTCLDCNVNTTDVTNTFLRVERNRIDSVRKTRVKF